MAGKVVVPMRPLDGSPVVGVILTEAEMDMLQMAAPPEEITHFPLSGITVGSSKYMPEGWLAYKHADGSLSISGPTVPRNEEEKP